MAKNKCENQIFKHPSQFLCYMIEPNREIWWLENNNIFFFKCENQIFKHPSQFLCYMIEPNREIWWLENNNFFLAILEKHSPAT